MQRNRLIYSILLLLTITVGLATRKLPEYMPAFIGEYGGDTLWALMIFWIVGFIFPQRPTWWVAVWALVFCFFIEISQLYQADWINAVRRTTFGALVLGRGFLWTDFVCYTIGVGSGWLIETLWQKSTK